MVISQIQCLRSKVTSINGRSKLSEEKFNSRKTVMRTITVYLTLRMGEILVIFLVQIQKDPKKEAEEMVSWVLFDEVVLVVVLL